jgi:Ferritin-like
MNQRFFQHDAFRNPALQLAGVAAAIDAESRKPMHDPPLEPRDEAVFLLTATAEVEHALMVQYLFAAYSLRVVEGSDARLRMVQVLLIQIAREEIGHLATVQNLLLLIGRPLNFGREHSPYANEIYPFRFKLEAVSLDSLAKYVVAESPLDPPSESCPRTIGHSSSR